MPAINAGNAVSFNVHGEIDIVIGATTHTLALKEPGTLTFTDGAEELRRYTDGGVQQTPIKGAKRLSTIAIDAKVAHSGTPANDLYSILRAEGTGGAPLAIASIQVRVPNDEDDTSGTSYTWANCWPTEDLVYQEGAEFDMVQLRFESRTARATLATYSGS